MAERTASRGSTKKPKKKPLEQVTPQQGLDVVQNLEEIPPLNEAMLREIVFQPVTDYEKEYMQDSTKPLNTNFLVPNKGKKGCCPVFFGTVEEKTLVVDILCQQMNPKTLKLWGTLSCYCGDVPRARLSRTVKNPNRVFVCCPKIQDMKCRFFQWIDQPPMPKKTCNAKALKQRFLEMVEEETVAKRGKEEGGGFYFNPNVFDKNVNPSLFETM